MVLTYRNDQLATIYSSTPSVQFVRLDLDLESESAAVAQAANVALHSSSRQLTVPPLHELPEGLHRIAQRAFRSS